MDKMKGVIFQKELDDYSQVEAQVELDNDGQIIIYTGYYDNGEDGICLWREPEDFQEKETT